MEIAEVGLRFSRHEYELNDDDNNKCFLLSRMSSNAPDWILCAPIEPEKSLTAQEAGGLSAGQTFLLDGKPARITKLFRSTFLEVDETQPQSHKHGDVLYGFSGELSSNILIARWNATSILWLKGAVLADREVKAAFAPGFLKLPQQ